jgi:hypothetical protein
VEAKLSYVYNEFFQIPSAFYHGMMIPITTEATTSIAVESNLPDLTIKGFRQPTLGTIAFDEENIKCGDAGDHIVRVYDGSTIIFADTLTLAGGIGMHFFPTAQLAAGTHTIRIVSDEPNAVTESDESNNVFETTITVPEADLIVKSITPVSTNLPNGSSAKFQAVIRNLGTVAGPYTVRFTANGVQIGGLVSVTGTAEGGESTVFSDLFTLTTNSEDCPIIIEAFADAGSAITEVSESNNTLQIKLASDLDPSPTGSEFGTAGNPVRVRVNTPKVFNVYVRNIGTRDISNVNVKFFHNSQLIGEEVVPYIKARKEFPAVASFTHTFTAVGIQTVTIIADDANVVCESDETNNTGAYMVQVTDSKEDYEVLSQYISPSALNPDAGQSITIVGTVKNVGNRVAPPNILQFFVDNIKLGVDVPFNALQPGQDTTVQASVPYSSLIPGVKVMKIVTDPNNGVDEEAELNNEATRILIVGDAPDMKRASANAIRFNPSGFSEGDSVTVSYSVVNGGSQQGTAWVLFYIYDEGDAVVGLDSVQFTLAAGASTTVSRKMLFDVTKGMVIAQIVNCSPIEFDLFNNADTLAFSTVGQLKSNITVNGNLDMEAALQDQLPGWIGGKLMIGDYNLVVNGSIVNYDTAHFVITNGAGKLQLVNSNAENIFPVGTSLFSSNFMRLNNAGTPDNFSVRVVDHVLKNGTAGDTVRTGNVDRTWFIEEQVTGGSNATIELFWNASHELPSFDRSISRTAHYTTSWQLGTAGPAAVDAIGRFSKTQAGYSGFSPFTVTSDIGGALPLRFISFDATLVDNDVKLKWVTDNEVSTSHFEVEFSSNGAGYSAIGRVNAANTGGRHEYNYVDLSPAGTVLYYRIKQVDIDGRFTYSNVVRMDLQDDQKIVLYPNPASTVISLKNVNPAEVKTITITAIDGRTLLVMVPVSSMQYDIGHLRDGTYVVTIIWKDKRAESRQFIKVSR